MMRLSNGLRITKKNKIKNGKQQRTGSRKREP